MGKRKREGGMSRQKGYVSFVRFHHAQEEWGFMWAEIQAVKHYLKNREDSSKLSGECILKHGRYQLDVGGLQLFVPWPLVSYSKENLSLWRWLSEKPVQHEVIASTSLILLAPL